MAHVRHAQEANRRRRSGGAKHREEAARRKAADVTRDNFGVHLMNLNRTLEAESERGCVLVASAFVEETLEALLRARLAEEGRRPRLAR